MVDALVDVVVGRLSRGEAVEPADLQFLVRAYAVTGRPEAAEVLGPALGEALGSCAADAERGRRAEWIELLAEAVSCSEDERLAASAVALAGDLSRQWPSRGRLGQLMRQVDACLIALQCAGAGGGTPDWLPHAVEELERLIGAAYEPGEGVHGDFDDHVRSAAALLSAFAVTGRLPYSMLAEELMQCARRRWWDSGRGTFVFTPALPDGPSSPITTSCAAARTLVRLASLHRDADYLEAAVVASDCDYAADAGRILDALGQSPEAGETQAGAYGLAILDYLMLTS